MSSYSINVTRVNSLNSINFTVFTEYSNASIDMPEYKIKITGVTDSTYFALYIKDTIDDEDAGDGTTMRRWYATMVANGTMVDWEDVI